MKRATSTGAPRAESRWKGEDGTVGTVAVVGMGKIGLPVAAQYLSAGWSVVGVDVVPAVVDTLNSGRVHFDNEPGVEELVLAGHADGRFHSTLDHAAAASEADVVVMIVPLMLAEARKPNYEVIDAATHSVGRGLRPSTLVIYETTLPVGDTRTRFGPALERASGLALGHSPDGLMLAFSPERVYSGRVLHDLSMYPKLVGGVDTGSTKRAAAFYRSVLAAEVREMSTADAAEFAKLAETTYRDVNIALANQFARYAEEAGVDVLEAIDGANSQPHSHIHQPGLGVGGHCIPVYPHFLISRSTSLGLVETARNVNDSQVGRYVSTIERMIAGLSDRTILVLGLTYREGVREMAYTRAIPLIRELTSRGASVSVYDPLISAEDVHRLGLIPYRWGTRSDVSVIVTQTADRLWTEMDFGLFPGLELLFDGRNSMRTVERPPTVAYAGVGLR